MAYIDFAADPVLPAQIAAPRHDAVPQEPSRLSALEWSVVALARRDGLSSLRRPGRLSVALGSVFGGQRRSHSLADPRLEALRRTAVLAWHRGSALSVADRAIFLDAGFSAAQFRTLLASIAAAAIPARLA